MMPDDADRLNAQPADRIIIPPPVPAPYLRLVKPLSEKLLVASDGRRRLSPALDLELAYEIRLRKDEIRRRRATYERLNHITICPERPYAP